MKCVIILQKKGPWYDLITEPTDKQDTYVSITQLSGGVFFLEGAGVNGTDNRWTAFNHQARVVFVTDEKVMTFAVSSG